MSTKISQSEKQKEKRMEKNEHTLRSLWDTNGHTNICRMEVIERQEREMVRKNI